MGWGRAPESPRTGSGLVAELSRPPWGMRWRGAWGAPPNSRGAGADGGCGRLGHSSPESDGAPRPPLRALLRSAGRTSR
eukprot:3332249-Alexandrium_andersonii.AAC.1